MVTRNIFSLCIPYENNRIQRHPLETGLNCSGNLDSVEWLKGKVLDPLPFRMTD